MHGQVSKSFQETVDKILNILSPEQRAQLHEEALGPLGRADHLDRLPVNLPGDPKPVYVYSLGPYSDFTQPSVRKDLGLSAAQEEQVRGILRGSTNLNEALASEVEKLPPQESENLSHTFTLYGGVLLQTTLSEDEKEQMSIYYRKKERAGFDKNPAMKPSIALRRQFEAVLTPAQLARYRDLAVRNFTQELRTDRLMLRMIGASDAQEAEVTRISRDSTARNLLYTREIGRRLLEILTPVQREALRADVEKEFVAEENAGGDAEPPADRGSSTSVSIGSGTLTLTGSRSNQSADSGSFTFSAKSDSGALTLAGSQANPPIPDLGDSASTQNHTGSTIPEEQNATVRLPVYADLGQAAMRKQFGIEFSSEQWKKLRAISADWQKKYNELAKDRPKTTDQKEIENFWTPVYAKLKEFEPDFRKQIEAVLTPEQLRTYQELKTGRYVRSPEVLKSMGVALSGEQQNKLQQVDGEDSEKWNQEIERDAQVVVAALSPQQREQLRIAVEQQTLATEDPSGG